MMTPLKLCIATITCCVCATAFAQSNPPAPATDSVAQNAYGGQIGSTGQSQGPVSYARPTQGLTRGQVYRQLVHAEQDGQLKYLDSTLYAHH